MRILPCLLFVACQADPGPIDPWADAPPTPFLHAPVAGQQTPVAIDLTLEVTPLVPGQPATWTVGGAQPGEQVLLFRAARAGNGPCAPGGAVCLDLQGPVPFGIRAADPAGVASWTYTVPATLNPGLAVAFQAVVPRGPGYADTSKSPPVETSVVAPPVRFVALGDAGEGNPDQFAVADAVEAVCDIKGCDFALYLGDNFYDAGVTSVTDPQFQDKFEIPYANLDFPFMVVAGNHDYGEVPIQGWRADIQVAYSDMSDKWTMPDRYYTFTEGAVDFFALDTNSIMLELQGVQDPDVWMINALAASTKPWRVAFGHHPYISNGQHGNAGNYEGAWYDITGLVRGSFVQDFMEDHVCGQIDLYLCGHDHNRQWLDATCGTTFIVAGAGSKTTDFVHRDNNPTIWEDDTEEGFTWVEIFGDTMTIQIYDKFGNLDHEGTITK